MTSKQIAKTLTAAGLKIEHMEIRRDEVEVWTGNETSTKRLANKVAKALGGWGGYRCGYGAWVLQAKTTSMGNYNNTSSRWHY